MDPKRGRVITFYSYKGGAGRSMAIANTACLLARRSDIDSGVLVVDWDLEAPGLHHFFKPATSEAWPKCKGVIDLFSDLTKLLNSTGSQSHSEPALAAAVQSLSIEQYITSTSVQKVSLMPAGRFDDRYAARVSGLDWRALFQVQPTLFREFAERLAGTYEYILIDSRTGLSDTSGICTALLPDRLVFVFTPNRQSLSGGVPVVEEAVRYRRESSDIRPLVVFPLPSRIDVSEPELLAEWRLGRHSNAGSEQGFQPVFESFFRQAYALEQCDLENYFNEIQIQHVPRYSYGEEIAAIVEYRKGTRLSLSRSYAAFADLLAGDGMPWSLRAPIEGGAELVSNSQAIESKIRATKDYIAEERFRVKLRDLVTDETRRALASLRSVNYQGPWSVEGLRERLRSYESRCADLLHIEALLGFWGDEAHRHVLTFAPERLATLNVAESGMVAWLALRLYPTMLLTYAGGVSAIGAAKYDNLFALLNLRLSTPHDPKKLYLAQVLGNVAKDLHGVFKELPGHERQYTPRSEYLFALLQPIVDDTLFLGPNYEESFDRFEMLLALDYAFRTYGDDTGPVWGPPGRFAWKASRGGRSNPLNDLLEEAEEAGSGWPPLGAGFFGGSLDTFRSVALPYRSLVASLGWW